MPTETKSAETQPLEKDGIINPAEYRRRFGNGNTAIGKPRRYWKGRDFTGDRRYRHNDRNKHK